MFLAIATAFLGGLILNFMPCVFPIIFLKAFGLVKQSGDPRRLRREGLAFFVGTLLAMMVLGSLLLALRAGGIAVGWGFQLQSPMVVVVLTLVMFGSGLNLAGLFEFGIGIQRVGQQMDHREGILGAALTGALAVVVATPCAGPFMAGALGYALVQPALIGLTVFASLATGVAAPFTFLSFMPGLARRLPRPGAWMGTMKHALAFPMFGAAAWLVWVFSLQTGSSGLALMLACVVGFSFLCWLYGMAQRRAAAGQKTQVLQVATVMGALALCTVVVMRGGALGRQRPSDASGMAISGIIVPDNIRPIAWTAARVAQEQAAGRPVFVDFSAAWCLQCQVNEKAVLSKQRFRQLISKTNAAYLVADSTKYDPAIEKAMSDLGRTGLPLYLVYPAGGGRPVILPQLLTFETINTALSAALRKKS